MSPGEFLTIVVITLLIVGAWTYFATLKRRLFRKILRMQKHLYGGMHEWRRVDAENYPHLDHEYYDRTQGFLAAHGFRHLGDFENTTLTGSAINPKCFLRVMSGMDGSVAAAYYQVAGPNAMQVSRLPATRFVEFEAESADGRFYCVSNTGGVDQIKNPPSMLTTQMPAGTPVDEVWKTFLDGFNKQLAATPPFIPRRLDTWDAVRASQDRSQKLKNEFRRKQGYLSREEFVKLGGPAGDYELFCKIAEEEAKSAS